MDSVSFRASPAQKRVNKLLSIGSLFLSCVDQHAKSWLELMGMLSSLTLLIPGVQLRMRSFQFALHRAWDRLDPEAFVRWSSEIRQDFFWLDRERLELVISLEQVSPQLDLWSDFSDVGWGSAPWFPELLELVVDDPVALPMDRDLLSQPHVHRQHLGLSRLALLAWRLSCDL